jgi:hypothetical protein
MRTWKVKSPLFWDVTQRWVVVLYWYLGETYWSHLQGSRSPTGRISCPETSVHNYHATLCNIPEERKSHLNRGGSLKWRMRTGRFAAEIVNYRCRLRKQSTVGCRRCCATGFGLDSISKYKTIWSDIVDIESVSILRWGGAKVTNHLCP